MGALRIARLEDIRSHYSLIMFNPRHLERHLKDLAKKVEARTDDRLDLITNLLIYVILKENSIMATIQDVSAAVAAESSVDDSIVTLLNGIVQQLKDAQASGDPAALDVIVAGIQANTKKIQ